ncbi:hypothetical protein RSAG8_03309, partial [Rhizoctonia solani AG-8 WAC10335]
MRHPSAAASAAPADPDQTSGASAANAPVSSVSMSIASDAVLETPAYDDGRSAKKLKREGSPSSYANGNGNAPANPNGARREEDVRQQDAARALEESFADEEGSER